MDFPMQLLLDSGKMAETCRGLTKKGLPCSITWELNAQGYCKFHVPKAAQYRGIARSTGRRCSIRWDLGVYGFCRNHSSQNPQQRDRQCLGIAQSTGMRCQHTVGIDKDGYCSAHSLVNGGLSAICQACS